ANMNKTANHSSNLLSGILCIVLFLPASIGMFFLVFPSIEESLGSFRWPKTTAKIEKGEFVYVHESRHSYEEANLEYTYMVGNKVYKGTRLTCYGNEYKWSPL